jgi:integrase
MKGSRSLMGAEVSQLTDSFTGTWALRRKALFVLGVNSGCRISELLSLRVGDV